MIIRVVKMTFKAKETGRFIEVFDASAEFIRSFDGCLDMKLMQDTAKDNVYFTLSRWQSEYHLNIYRSSDLFKATWAKVKPLFSEKAEAWSLGDIIPK